MRQITANVYVEDRFGVHPELRGCNLGFVTTSEGVVMIDTPFLPSDAAKWRDDIAQVGEVRFIINTDYHIDHTTGNYYFPGTVISHKGTREMFYAPLARVLAGERFEEPYSVVDFIRLLVKEIDPEGLPLPEQYQRRAPTITFSERLNLYVGEHTFELIHLSGHTPSHIGVHIPQERIFFAGDNVTNGEQPSLAHCLPLQWIESLKKIDAMDIDVVVPGHGKVCGKREAREFASFVQKCIDIVREAIKQGMSKEEVVDRISFSELLPAQHPDPGMQRRNVLRLYEMLSQ